MKCFHSCGSFAVPPQLHKFSLESLPKRLKVLWNSANNNQPCTMKSTPHGMPWLPDSKTQSELSECVPLQWQGHTSHTRINTEILTENKWNLWHAAMPSFGTLGAIDNLVSITRLSNSKDDQTTKCFDQGQVQDYLHTTVELQGDFCRVTCTRDVNGLSWAWWNGSVRTGWYNSCWKFSMFIFISMWITYLIYIHLYIGIIYIYGMSPPFL